MKKYIKKADVLIEALPYLQSFKGKIFVIKYGGQVLLNKEISPLVLQDIAFLNTVGIKPVLVHGGGPLINQKVRELGKQPKFIDGIRVTDDEGIKVVAEVLENLNKSIVDNLKSEGALAKGIISEHKLMEVESAGKELGHVGRIKKVNVKKINNLLEKDIIPVICPLTEGVDGKVYNVNADSVVSEIAVGLKTTKLVLLTHVSGIMKDSSDENTLISSLYTDEVQDLIESNNIHGGMIPKVKAGCFTVSRGVDKVHIIDGNIPHALLLEIFTDQGIGTQILKSK